MSRSSAERWKKRNMDSQLTDTRNSKKVINRLKKMKRMAFVWDCYVSQTVISLTALFPEGFFPDNHFPASHFPETFPRQSFAGRSFPGQTFLEH